MADASYDAVIIGGGIIGVRVAVRGGERVIRPVLAVCVLALAGRMLGDLEAFAVVTASPGVEATVRILKYVVPNLDLFDVRNAAVHGLPIVRGHVLWAVAYALIYSSLVLVISDLIFRRREFK